jgi:hypothetical protein
MNGRQISSVYINGEPVIMSVIAGSSLLMNTAATDNIYVGGSANSGTANSLNGAVGQFSAYSSALTQDQIRQNYNFTKPSYPNGFDGAISGATWNAGGYFDFNNNQIELSANQAFTPSADLTITGWFKLDAIPDNTVIYLFTNGDSQAEYSAYIYTGGQVRFQVWNSSNGNYAQLFTTTNISTNIWYNLTYLISANNFVKVYLNGTVIDTETSLTGSLVYKQKPLHLGGRSGSTNNFDGKISKFKMYDRILTDAEITAIHTEGQ